MKKPTQIELAWLAGIIEGEGSITAHLVKKTPKKNRKGYYGGIATQLSVSNTEKDMCDEVERLFCKILGKNYGRVHVNQRKTETGRIAYRSCLTGHQPVKKVLRAILPYMKTKSKKRQAELVIKICNRKKYSRVTDKEIDFITEIQYLHGGHKLSVETIRQRVLKRRTQDIVRTATKVAEIDRNINPPQSNFVVN